MLLKNCRLIPELSGNIKFVDSDIEIVDGRIKGVYESGTRDGFFEQVVDMGGRTVLPGFIDLHVHLGLSAGSVLEDNIRTVGKQVLDAMRYAQSSLKAGFTTLRDAGAAYGAATSLRNEINSGRILGPNILACGKILTPTETGNDYFHGLYSEFNGRDEAIAFAREEFKAGADYIKVMGSGAFMNPGGEPGAAIALDEELKALVEIASMKNSYVAVHAHGPSAVRQAIRCKVRTIEHGSMVDEAGIEELKAEGSFLVPTVIGLFTWDEATRNNPREWEKIEPMLSAIERSIKNAYKAGLKLGFGTDMGVPDCLHGENGKEFIIRHDLLGMSPLDILLQATRYSAEIAMIDNKVGTIEAGKAADLVVVDGNPLKDIRCVKDAITCIYKDGKKVEL